MESLADIIPRVLASLGLAPLTENREAMGALDPESVRAGRRASATRKHEGLAHGLTLSPEEQVWSDADHRLQAVEDDARRQRHGGSNPGDAQPDLGDLEAPIDFPNGVIDGATVPADHQRAASG